MNCPACRAPMLVVEYDQVELDACPACRGFWFDAGELDLLLEKVEVPEGDRALKEILVAVTAPGKKGRPCPLCRKRMRKARVGAAGPVIDLCAREEGIWFDHGEIGPALATAGPHAAAGRVLAYLHAAFPGKE